MPSLFNDEFVFRKLVDHLNALREKLENEEVHHEASNKLDTCVEDGVHILLKLKPNLRIALMARLSELERKINNLENLVGSTTGATVMIIRISVFPRTRDYVYLLYSTVSWPVFCTDSLV